MNRTSGYHVYMVRCTDGSYYTGYTNHLEERVKMHNAGYGAKCLRGKRPVVLVYVKAYRYYKNAIKAEAFLKSKTKRFKEDLVISHGV